ncbi:unknown [Bacteroides sp. CAG:754]|nr:unknown [Bacteroides sp. CAG:754]
MGLETPAYGDIQAVGFQFFFLYLNAVFLYLNTTESYQIVFLINNFVTIYCKSILFP